MGIITPPVSAAVLNAGRLGIAAPTAWPAQGAVSVVNWSVFGTGSFIQSQTGWTQSGGTANYFTVNAGGGVDIVGAGDAVVMYDTGAAAYFVEANIPTSSATNFPIAVCVKDANNFIGLRTNQTSQHIELFQRVGGNWTTLLSIFSHIVTQLQTNYRVEVRQNNTVAVYWENTLVGVAAIPDALAGGTKIGMMCHGGTILNAVGNWNVYTGPALRGEFTGSYCWFAEPRAISENGTTWLSYTKISPSDQPYGSVCVQQRNHYTGVVTEYLLVTAYNWFDDHANATFLIRPDGRLIAFYCYHGDNTGIAYRISVNPYDASAWGAQVRFNIGSAGPWGLTYPSPVMLSSEGNNVYVFYRDGDSNFSYVTSTDMATVAAPASDGAAQTAATWSTLSVVIAKPGDYTIKGVYARITNDGTSRIDIAASYASGPGGPPFVDVRHMYYQSGKWYNSAGAELRLVSGYLAPVATTFTATLNATSITVASATGIVLGMPVLANGYIPSGCVVSNIAGNVITLSVPGSGNAAANEVTAAASGVAVQFLPYTWSHLTAIATAGAPDNQVSSWIWDVVRNPSDGKIYVVWAQTSDLGVHQQYWWARWDGAAWSKQALPSASTGMLPNPLVGNQTYYAPGIALDPSNFGVVYASLGNVAGTACSLYRYTTADAGVTWAIEPMNVPFVSGSQYVGKVFRPFVPRNRDRRCGVVFLSGSYDNYCWDVTLGSYHCEILTAPV